jgi:hypothetical protein
MARSSGVVWRLNPYKQAEEIPPGDGIQPRLVRPPRTAYMIERKVKGLETTRPRGFAMSKKEDATLAKVNAEIDECAALLEVLRARYEQYFLGIERIPPERERKDVFRRLHQLEHLTFNNTATKFRLQTLSQKFRTYGEYWSRTLRQIEDGTYVRHVAKARKLVAQQAALDKAAAQQAAAPAASAASASAASASAASASAASAAARTFLDEIGDLADDFLSSLGQTFNAPPAAPSKTTSQAPATQSAAQPAAQSAAQPAAQPAALSKAAAASPPKPPPTPPAVKPIAPAATGDDARSLYDQFTQARAQASGGRPGAAVPAFDDFKRSLDRQADQLRQGNPSRRVRFRVVVQDGRPLIQPLIEP